MNVFVPKKLRKNHFSLNTKKHATQDTVSHDILYYVLPVYLYKEIVWIFVDITFYVHFYGSYRRKCEVEVSVFITENIHFEGNSGTFSECGDPCKENNQLRIESKQKKFLKSIIEANSFSIYKNISMNLTFYNWKIRFCPFLWDPLSYVNSNYSFLFLKNSISALCSDLVEVVLIRVTVSYFWKFNQRPLL